MARIITMGQPLGIAQDIAHFLLAPTAVLALDGLQLHQQIGRHQRHGGMLAHVGVREAGQEVMDLGEDRLMGVGHG